MQNIGAKIFATQGPACNFVHDLQTFSSPLASRPMTLIVPPDMYRRKVWFSAGYVGALDANFMIDSEIVFSYKGERIFGLPFQYNSRSGTAAGSPCDIFWSANPSIVNPGAFVINDEPLFADVSGTVTLGATPFRGTFVCDKVEWQVSRSLLTGAEKLYAMLAVHSEYPY
jgi:hypothetical protein